MARKKKAKAPPKKMGRPRSVMTDEAIAAILRTVRLGIYPDRAAQMHGVDPAAMRMHKSRNKDFVAAIEKAEAEAEASTIGRVIRHMDKQWTACAWMLERRWPARWAKRDADHDDAKNSASKQSDDADKWRDMMAAIPGRVMPTAAADAPAQKPAEDDTEC